MEIVSEKGDKWEVRNITTHETVLFEKAVLERAIRLGKAEEILNRDDSAAPQ